MPSDTTMRDLSPGLCLSVMVSSSGDRAAGPTGTGRAGPQLPAPRSPRPPGRARPPPAATRPGVRRRSAAGRGPGPRPGRRSDRDGPEWRVRPPRTTVLRVPTSFCPLAARPTDPSGPIGRPPQAGGRGNDETTPISTPAKPGAAAAVHNTSCRSGLARYG